jgi:hypothetical protein
MCERCTNNGAQNRWYLLEQTIWAKLCTPCANKFRRQFTVERTNSPSERGGRDATLGRR